MATKWYIRRADSGLQLNCLEHSPADAITRGFDSYTEARTWLERMERKEAERSRGGDIVCWAWVGIVVAMVLWGIFK